eukprot:909743-Prymnesium_polylepis.1
MEGGRGGARLRRRGVVRRLGVQIERLRARVLADAAAADGLRAVGRRTPALRIDNQGERALDGRLEEVVVPLLLEHLARAHLWQHPNGSHRSEGSCRGESAELRKLLGRGRERGLQEGTAGPVDSSYVELRGGGCDAADRARWTAPTWSSGGAGLTRRRAHGGRLELLAALDRQQGDFHELG